MTDTRNDDEKETITTDDELEAMARRCACATVGPWESLSDPEAECAWLNTVSHDRDTPALALFDYQPVERNIADAEFCAHARTDMPRLLAEVRTLRERVHGLLKANTDEVLKRTIALRERDDARISFAILKERLAASVTQKD